MPSQSVVVLFGLCSWLKRLWIMSVRLVLGSRQSWPAGHNPSSSTSRVKTNGCSTNVTTLKRCPSTESPGLQRPPALPSPWPSPPLTPAPRPCPWLLPNPPTSPNTPSSKFSRPLVHWPTVTQAGWPRAPLFRLHTWNSWEERTRERPESTCIRPVAPVKEVLERNLKRQRHKTLNKKQTIKWKTNARLLLLQFGNAAHNSCRQMVKERVGKKQGESYKYWCRWSWSGFASRVSDG